MQPTPGLTQLAPARRAASTAIAALAVLLASGCGDAIVAPAEDAREELLAVRITYPDPAAPGNPHHHFAWIAPDGSGQRIHPDRIHDARSVSVSPDREWVAYRDQEAGLQMKRMRTDGTGVVDLGAPGAAHTPHWSAEGSLLAIQTDDAIYVMPASGGSAVDVSSAAIADDGVCPGTGRTVLRGYGFTGDGRVTFDNYVCGVGSHYYSVRIDGSDSRRITEFDPERAHWSPDGTRVLFAEGGAVHLMNADGSGRRVLEDGGVLPHRYFNHSNPWSPDGRRVSFIAALQAGAPPSIVVLDVDGPGRTEIETVGAWPDISWSRDGRVAFSAVQGDGVAVFVADPGTGVVMQVTPSGERFERPVWVPAR